MRFSEKIICVINPAYKKRYVETKYKQLFEEQYSKVNNIKKTLDGISGQLIKHKKMYKLVLKANSYLEISLIKDYKTALNYINNEYPALKEFHNQYIEKAKEQQFYMLVDKGGNTGE